MWMGDNRTMQDWPTPIEAALTVAAVAGPFLAGLGVVLWSKARAQTDRAAAGRLRSMRSLRR
jgi:hypothetical protein